MVGTDDGRFVVRVGRQMAFLKGDGRSPALLLAKLGEEGDSVLDWFWDCHGDVFGAVMRGGGQHLLKIWPTQAGREFPDFTSTHAVGLATNSLVVAANDRLHTLIRNPDQGLGIFEAGRNRFQVIDPSDLARQKQPMAASHDGRFLAMVSDNHRIRLLELPTGKFFAEFVSRRRAPIRMIAWRPDGQQLATVTEDGYIQLWALTEWWKALA